MNKYEENILNRSEKLNNPYKVRGLKINPSKTINEDYNN
jgi:hypothetical protein